MDFPGLESSLNRDPRFRGVQAGAESGVCLGAAWTDTRRMGRRHLAVLGSWSSRLETCLGCYLLHSSK